MYPLFRALGFIFYELNAWIPGLGIAQDSLGSVQVTSVGELGIDEAYGPLDPYARLPFMVVAGRIKDAPVAVNGRVEVRPVLPLCFSADHRIGDAFVFGRFMNELRSLLGSHAFLTEAEPARDVAA
jgi:pyruvate/2-oxoglutarate dehydrogenase complex dihydrolipoamide acyltransferase (E2) component